jgi:hypothetical protein
LQRKRVGQLGKRDREEERPATPKTLQRIQLFVLVIVGHDRSWVEGRRLQLKSLARKGRKVYWK